MDIIINKADKRGAVVIMNTKHYLKMINHHLNDELTYKILEANCEFLNCEIIEKCKDSLTKKGKIISYQCLM